ncbi:MAG TPA: hypothetical protein VD906_03135 [Caulobacteraceae bacterium]|nr:hypothetical protein [Caulobacteraceae bacterium]
MLAWVRAALMAALVGLLAPAAAQAAWMRAETPRFILYSDGGEGDLRAYAARLEGFDALLRFFHGLPAGELPQRKLPIYLLGDRRDLQRLQPGLAPGVAGFYRSSLGDVYGAATVGEDLGEQTLYHEYVHHFMHQHFPSTYPGWLIEGYAEYLKTAEVNDSRFRVGLWNESRAAALDAGGYPLGDLLTRPAAEIKPGRQRQAYYAQAWLLTHYMMGDAARQAQLAAYVRGLAAGKAPLAAWSEAVGSDLAALDRNLKAYQRRTQNRTFERAGAEAVSVEVTRLPEAAGRLLLEDQRLRAGVPAGEREALVAEVRRRAAAFAGERPAQLTLARAEVLYGDRAAGEAMLQRLLEADGRDVEALRLMGQSRMEAAADDPQRRRELLAQARSFFGRAYKIEPNHYQTLYGYARSRSAEPGYPSDNDLNVLRLALQLAPQVDRLRLNTGRALLRRKLYPEAATVLWPLANDPHGGALSRRAQSLMDQIKAGLEITEDSDKEGDDG